MLEKDDNNHEKEKFLYPTAKYYGKFTPENLAFNANLQEFAQRVSYLCGLESNGKICTQDAYEEIKNFWKQLEKSRQSLFENEDSADP
jgi:cephalosporin-C deacetylase-like acetyl esterase